MNKTNLKALKKQQLIDFAEDMIKQLGISQRLEKKVSEDLYKAKEDISFHKMVSSKAIKKNRFYEKELAKIEKLYYRPISQIIKQRTIEWMKSKNERN